MKHQRSMPFGLFAVVACAMTAAGCSGDDTGPAGSGGVAPDAGSAGGAGGAGGNSTSSGSSTTTGGAGGAGGGQNAACATANAHGFFPDCSLCGTDCDSIDDGTGVRRACGCTGGCPCGLHCGSYEIAPNVTVSGICVR
jgi:hypothetical protein